MTDPINLTQLRERARRQEIYRKVEELHDWPVEEVLALITVAETARDFRSAILDVSSPEEAGRWIFEGGKGTAPRIEQASRELVDALARFTE